MMGEEITTEIFSFTNDEALDDSWNRFQKPSMHFLLNTGSLLIPIMTWVLICCAITRVVHYMAIKCHKYNSCRKIGASLYPKLDVLPYALTALFLQGSLDFMMASLL